MCRDMQHFKTQYHVLPISQAYGIDFAELFDIYMVKF